jgi:hypothetical protein
MKLAATVTFTLLIGFVIVACGGSGHSSSTASAPVSSSAAFTGKRPPLNAQALEIANYGRGASPAERRAITQIVDEFYRAAGADDGAKACKLIYSILEESIAQDYGQAPAPPSLRGSTCAVVMSKLFEQVPGQPPAVLAGTKVLDVRVKGINGYALLRSSVMPEGEIQVKRELGNWKIASLVGIPLPGTPPTSEEAKAVSTETRPQPLTPAPANSPKARHPDSADGDEDPESNDDEEFVDFGHEASEEDRRAVTTLVEHYYRAAAAQDGKSVCANIYAVVVETIPEQYAHSPQFRGSSCEQVMHKVFKHMHTTLAAEVPRLRVTRVRVSGAQGVALVYLGKRPEPYVLLHREGNSWKMKSLFEVGLP